MNKLLITISNLLFVLYLIFCGYILVNRAEIRDASVLFRAELEEGYPFVGYIMMELNSGGLGICGVNYIGARTALTAAHCLENTKRIYPNVGEFDSSYKTKSFAVQDFKISPFYSGLNFAFNAGKSDIAVIQLAENVQLSQFAKIATPDEGCDYYITGYGRNEDGLTRERKGGKVCITEVEDERFQLSTSGPVFFCQGDSGSGIYETNTNKLVGLVSSFALIEKDDTCEEATSFFAVRVDANEEFITRHLVNSQTNSAITTNDPSQTIIDSNESPEDIGSLYVNVIDTIGIENVMIIYSSVVFILIFVTIIVAIRYYRQPQIVVRQVFVQSRG